MLVPAVMQALSQHPLWPTTDLTSLRAVATGSSLIPVPLIEAFNARGIPVIQIYGSTETGPIAVYTRVGGDLSRMTSTGLPGLFCDAKVVDDDGREVPHGTAGEVIVRGPNVLYEYWGNAEATAEALRDGWYHTGDIGTRDRGRLFLHPRPQEEHDHFRRREHLSRRSRTRAARPSQRRRSGRDRPPRSEMAGGAGRLYRVPQGHERSVSTT